MSKNALSHNLLSKSRHLIDELGVINALLYSIHSSLHKLSSRAGLYKYYFYQQPLSLPESVPRRKSSYTFTWLSEKHPALTALGRSETKLSERFAHGDRCLIATKDDEFCGCIWIATQRYNEDEVRCLYRMGQHDVWDYDVFVMPKYRIGRLFMQLWAKASEDLITQGYRQSVSRISAYKRNSIVSHEKLGAQRIGQAVFLVIGNLQLFFASRKPFVHVTLGKSSRPEVNLEQ